MHMIIRALVYANSADEALNYAERNIFDVLVDNQRPFDYYETFKGEGTCISGKGRWGNIPYALRADSKEGKKMIREGWKFQCSEQKYHWDKVKSFIKKYNLYDLRSGDYKRNGGGMMRYHFNQLGQYSGGSVMLYDQDGEGITDKAHLNDVLTKWDRIYGNKKEYKENPYCNLAHTWVVPADVHL